MKTSKERLYVIGAGASFTSGLPTLKTLTRDLCESLVGEERAILLAAILESFGKPLRPNDSLDFEELLNRLEPRALFCLEDTGLGGQDSFRQKAYRLALRALREFVREKCILVADQETPYDRLVRSLKDGSTIVSFNWDVLLEHAFYRAKRAFSYLPGKNSPAGSSIILKPHGSINWFALLDRELLALDLSGNLDALGGDLTYYMLYLKEPLGQINLGQSSPFLKDALSPVPAIVPPSATKVLSVGGEPRDGWVQAGHDRVMKRTWSTFKTALDNAEELVVIGYSLPGTDAASIELFKHFAVEQGKVRKRRVLLVEPNGKIRERYKTLLGIDVRVVCRDFGKFDLDSI